MSFENPTQNNEQKQEASGVEHEDNLDKKIADLDALSTELIESIEFLKNVVNKTSRTDKFLREIKESEIDRFISKAKEAINAGKLGRQ